MNRFFKLIRLHDKSNHGLHSMLSKFRQKSFLAFPKQFSPNFGNIRNL